MKKTIILLLFIIQLSNVFGIDKDISLTWKDNDKTRQNALPLFSGANLNLLGLPIYNEVLANNGETYQLQVTASETVNENLILDKNIKKQLSQSFELKQELYNKRKEPFIQLTVLPYRFNPTKGVVERITSFRIIKSNTNQAFTRKANNNIQHTYNSSSVLKTGRWYKIRIDQTGIQKLTYSQLKELGIQNPENVRVYGNDGKKLPTQNSESKPDDLNEIPTLQVSKSGTFSDGDFVLFYAEKGETWQYDATKKLFKHKKNPFSSYTYCYLTSDLGKGKTVQTINEPSTAANQIVTSFDDYAYNESDTENLLHSGSEWYGELFSAIVTNYSFNYTFPHLATSSTGKVYFDAAAQSSQYCTFSINYNSTTIGQGSTYPSDANTWATKANGSFSFNPNTDNINLKINFSRQSDPDAKGWLNYIGVNVRRNLTMDNAPLAFRDQNSFGVGNIAQFNIQNTTASTLIWDITNINEVGQMQSSSSGNGKSFKANADILRQYIAFDPTRDGVTPTLKGDNLGLVENQNLHGLPNNQLIIVTHPNFINAANSLANFRKTNDKLTTTVVTTNQIYNEFSAGIPDVSAIRNFVKMFYDRATNAQEAPRYLLLIGDGSYDNHTINPNNPNFIPSYESENSTIESLTYVSDDFFGLLDNNEGDTDGLLDIGIGRFPVQTADQADSIVGKIKRYATANNFGQWRNQFCFLADDGDNNMHLEQADKLANKIIAEHPTFNVEKIFLDAYQQVTTSSGQSYPDVNKQFEDRIRKGALIINYTGHGGVLGLTNEQVITNNTINNYNNYSMLPLFITASCEFSRWDDVDMTSTNKFSDKTSAGEYTLLNTKGGTIALFTTTRVVIAYQNFDINNYFYNYTFKIDPLTNQPYRLGDIVRLAKDEAGSSINNRCFTLLGDPSLMLANPAITTIRTDSINGTSTNLAIDTIKALSKVRINGSVCDASGVLDPTFNGTLTVIIFDKATKRKNLQNEGDPIVEFYTQENTIYKGKVSVENGKFQFSFIVPKDINYSYGLGKISYYAENEKSDRTGVFNKAVIGGLSSNAVTDTKGPTIKLGMNSISFANGSIVNQTPNLMANIEDENGINTSGIGVGHDITAVLDDNTNNKFVLNDYYEADKDSYNKGKLVYPFTSLSEGSHKLKLKVWDVANNSSESTIDFVVMKNESLTIEHVLNYPNPFTTKTNFYFNHNKPGQILDIQIQIFTVAGKLVKTIRTTSNSTGFTSEPIFWDGKDDYGDKIGRGVYIYRLKVKDQDGKTAEKYEKLLLLH